MRIGDRVITDEGIGTIKKIDLPESVNFRFGVLHDVWPTRFNRESFKNDLLYYFPNELKQGDK